MVLTDIGGDPDDQQSMRRLLLYANEFEIAGLIASASGTPGEVGGHVTRPDLIREIVDDYARVWDSLRRHDARYPHPDALRAVVRSGSPNRGVNHIGPDGGTGGSRHLVSVVDAAPGPAHIAIWGGAHDLAQALYDVRADRGAAELSTFVSKLRVFAIGDQDAPRREGIEEPGRGTGEWIRASFPQLRYMQAGRPGISPYAALFRGMYQNDSAGGDPPVLQLVPDSLASLNQEAWVNTSIRADHGALGAGYPLVSQNPRTPRNTRGVKEGDTPSWFFFLPNGLSDPEDPTYGGWGGRFVRTEGNHFFDAEDEHWSGATDVALRRKWTVARWREAYQNDFAARMDWSVRPFAEANHNPVAVVDGDRSRRVLRRAALPGEPLVLDARHSYDPDGDRLSYRWWVYREPSSHRGPVKIDRADDARATLHVPRDAAGQTIHVILEISDTGRPRLTSYRRLVVDVQARPNSRLGTTSFTRPATTRVGRR